LDDIAGIRFLKERKDKLLSSTMNKIKKIENDDTDAFYNNFLFDSNHKWMTVVDIVKKIIPEKVALTKLYIEEIITKRNRLAHVKESKDAKGQKQLTDADFVFNDRTSKEILNAFKKHEENMDSILGALR
jgi:hypothetical protein